MPKRNLDEAVALQEALMQVIVGHPGGRNDAAAMNHVSALCARAVESVDDLEARVLIRGIESLAKLLFMPMAMRVWRPARCAVWMR